MSQYINPTNGSLEQAVPPSATRRRNIVAGILVAAALGAAAIGLYNNQPWTAGQPSTSQAQNATVASLTSGFEYGTEATAAKFGSLGVTSQYFGVSDELWP
ncbi:MAG: hypothetical protein U9N79_10455, partial [Actinomycetota bacterium]|nr:hypothetical protein [Actinomycetota bacterium]